MNGTLTFCEITQVDLSSPGDVGTDLNEVMARNLVRTILPGEKLETSGFWSTSTFIRSTFPVKFFC